MVIEAVRQKTVTAIILRRITTTVLDGTRDTKCHTGLEKGINRSIRYILGLIDLILIGVIAYMVNGVNGVF